MYFNLLTFQTSQKLTLFENYSQMSHLNLLKAFSTNFCPIKTDPTDLSGNTV